MSQQWIQVSKPAQAFLEQQSIKQKHCGIRIWVKKAGCSGYKYQIAWQDEPNAGDLVQAIGNIKCFIDVASVSALHHMQIDLECSALGQKKIIFKNPNADLVCGCGESFALKEET